MDIICTTGSTAQQAPARFKQRIFKPMPDHRPGSIRRLTLENIQVYRSQTFNFSAGLNLIAAPNGSGKSAIASALAVLFGSVRVLGRGRGLADIIRFGATSASVTATVCTANGDLVLCKRLSVSGEHIVSSYMIDGVGATAGAFRERVTDLGIDVASLCNFLPQERVSEFSGLQPRVLLEGAAAAQGDVLSAVEKSGRELEVVRTELEIAQKAHELAEAAVADMQNDVAALREREECVRRLREIEYSLLYIEYSDYKERYVSHKAAVTKARDIAARHQATLDESRAEIAALEASEPLNTLRAAETSVRAQNQEIVEGAADLRNAVQALETSTQALEECEARRKQRATEAAQAKKAVHEAETRLAAGTAELTTAIEQAEEQIASVAEQLPGGLQLAETHTDASAPLPERIAALEERATQLRAAAHSNDTLAQISGANHRAQALEREIDSLEKQRVAYAEQSARRLALLQKYHADTHAAVLWLRANRSLFQAEVLEPAFLHIKLHAEFQAELETLLGFQALSSFLVQSPADFSLLAHHLKGERRLAVNIAEVPAASPPALSKELLEEFHLSGVATDFVTARPEYIAFLNVYGGFNTIPIAKGEINEAAFFERVRACRRIVAGGHYIEIKRSRYGSDYIITTSPISAKGLFSLPAIEIDAVAAQLRTLRAEREDIRKILEKLYAEKTAAAQAAAQRERLLDLAPVHRAAYRAEQMQAALASARSQLAQCTRNDNRLAELRATRATREEAVRASVRRLETLLTPASLPALRTDTVRKAVNDLLNAQRVCAFATNALAAAEGTLATATAECEDARAGVTATKGALRTLFAKHPEAKTTIAARTCEELAEQRLELTAEKRLVSARLGKLPGSEAIQARVQTQEERSAAAAERLRVLSEQHAQAVSAHTAVCSTAHQRLQETLRPISERFGSLMARFGYAGQLELHAPGDSAGHWGVTILVSFRRCQPPEPLTATRQSGGERSLATALFLLALQDNTPVPFRLLDEINQGMDEASERKLFEILSERSAAVQLFIITPKLLREIELPEDARAIVLYSGRGVVDTLGNYVAGILARMAPGCV